MGEAIYLLQEGGALIAMQSEPYDSEGLLQELLAKHPHLLAGEQIDAEAPRRWLLVSREMAVPAEEGGSGPWAIDHLFLDQDGVPTLIEVKRATDSRIRREVVGQMLDYAANAVVYWPVEDIRARYEAAQPEPRELPAEFLGEDADPEEFWQRVKTNLQAGRVRLVFVADRIPLELRRVVEFLNAQMDPAEVLALEIEQFVGSGHRTLVPRIVGQTAEAERRKGAGLSPRRQWDETTFFEALAVRGPQAVWAAREIQAWALRNDARVEYGRGRDDGSMVPSFTHAGNSYNLFATYTYGRIEIYFQHLKPKPPFNDEDKRLELRRRLNEIPGVNIPPDGISRRPSIRLDLLAAPEIMKQFLRALDWTCKRSELRLWVRAGAGDLPIGQWAEAFDQEVDERADLGERWRAGKNAQILDITARASADSRCEGSFGLGRPLLARSQAKWPRAFFLHHHEEPQCRAAGLLHAALPVGDWVPRDVEIAGEERLREAEREHRECAGRAGVERCFALRT